MQRLLLGLVLIGTVLAQDYFNEVSTATTNCPCGWGVKGRIVGGKESKPNSYPFMVGLTLLRGSPFCGATLISSEHVLTAAHCTVDIQDKIKYVRVLIGAHDVKTARSDQYIPVSRTIEHPDYDPDNNEANDIAIVVLSRAVTFRNDVGPACLPNRKVNLENHHLLVAGWGLTTHEGEVSRYLREVRLRVIPWATCYRFYPRQLLQAKTQFCTYGKKKDSCQGDSGGSLMAIDMAINKYVQVGLVSYGRECGSENPAVNTDVTCYVDWIRSVVKESRNGTAETCSRIW